MAGRRTLLTLRLLEGCRSSPDWLSSAFSKGYGGQRSHDPIAVSSDSVVCGGKTCRR